MKLIKTITLLFCFISLTLLMSYQVFAVDVQKALVLHSYHKGFAWTDNVMSGMDSVLKQDGIDIETYVEYMDTKRHSPEESFPVLKKLYEQRYKDMKFNVILLSDNNALNFLLANSDDLFPGVPVVFSGINNFNDDMISGHSEITGVAEDIDIKGTIELALRLHPGINKIAVVNDRTPTGINNQERLSSVISAFEDKVEFIDLIDLTVDELKYALSTLSDDTLILLFTFHRDSTGRQITMEEYLRIITSAADVPVYSFWEQYIGKGVTGGRVVYGTAQGEKAANMGIRILNGEEADSIEVVRKSPNIPMFDHDQLIRFSIPLSSLPEKAELINRPESFYEKNKRFVWSVSIVITVLSLLVFLLSFNIIKRKRVEEELVKHRDHLEELVEQRTAELKQNEERLRMINDATFEGIAIIERGKIIDANQQFAEMFGYSLPEIPGKIAIDFIAPEHRDLVVQRIKEAYQEAYEITALKKDGSRFNIEARGKQISYKGRAARQTVVRDITERKKAEKSLQQSEERLRTLIQSIRTGVVVHAADTSIFQSNAMAQKLLGLTEDQLLGKKAIDQRWRFFSEEGNDMPLEEYPVNQVISSQKILEDLVVGVYRPETDDIVWLLVNAVPEFDQKSDLTRVIITFVDITERRKAEEEKKKLIHQLREALANVKTLSGLIPICSSCQKIRDDKGYWNKVADYMSKHSEAEFTHGYCPECIEKMKKTYPEYFKKKDN